MPERKKRREKSQIPCGKYWELYADSAGIVDKCSPPLYKIKESLKKFHNLIWEENLPSEKRYCIVVMLKRI